MVAFSGLLDGRRGTGHWSAIPEITSKHPTMEYVPDRRYVADDRVVTSTGITANVPVMIALVEAIGGRDVAQRVADELGVTNWDARHNSSAFVLSTEHKKTFVRNGISLWRHETLGVPIADGVDEVALGFYVDAYSRTQLAKVLITTAGGEAVRSKHGLLITPDAATETAKVSEMLPPPPTTSAAALLEVELPKIAERYDLPTAAIVAQTMEYPWKTAQVVAASP
jgi:transcriptional regulator GlxA family with amidase domain